MKSYLIILIVLLFFGSSCRKAIDVGNPRTQLTSTAVFANDATATGALFSIYAQMETQGMFYRLLFNTGLSGDEFRVRVTEPNYVALATNNLSANNTITQTHWSFYYSLIYQLNSLLEGITRSTALTGPVSRTLRGEALTVRSLIYFYLTNLYGEVPLVTSTDYTVNARLGRSAIDSVYALIKSNLLEAESLLDNSYYNTQHQVTIERVRPNRAAVQALLARVYLYQKEWEKAAEKAGLVIANNAYRLQTNLDQVFLKNSAEQIWQIMSVLTNINSYNGNQLVLTGAPLFGHFDSTLVRQFRPGDKRRLQWIGTITASGTTWYYPFKYKVKNSATISEYTSVLRLAEQYLIRAEARAMLNDLSGACSDLSAIRVRAGLPAVSSLTAPAILDSLMTERCFELFAESGDRWFNLKRTNKLGEVLIPLKGANWNETDALYPIPFNERLLNPALTQNPGY